MIKLSPRVPKKKKNTVEYPIKSLKPQMVKNFSKDKNKIYNNKQNQPKKKCKTTNG